jgi:hypothetical protein
MAINAIRPRHTGMSNKLVFITLCATLAVSGCGLLHKTLEVDSAAVAEVRTIGKVVAQTKIEDTWKSTTQLDEFLLMDLGAVDYDAAHDKARDQLERLGWQSTHTIDWTRMISTKWKHTVLKIDSFKRYESYGRPLEPQTEKALMAEPNRTNTYVILTLTRIG